MFEDKEREQFFVELKRAFPALSDNILSATVVDLFDYSRDIHRYLMIECNDRSLTSMELSAFEGIEFKAHALAKAMGFEVEIPDVRSGAGITVKLPTKRYNNMGGETWHLFVE